MSLTINRRNALHKLENLKKKLHEMDTDEIDTLHEVLDDLADTLGRDDLFGNVDAESSPHHSVDVEDENDEDLFDHIVDDEDGFSGGDTGGGGASSDWED